MYSLRVRFAERRSCLEAMQADMSAVVGRHIRRAVDGLPWAAASNGYTVAMIHEYALDKGLHVAEFSEHRGDYVLRYENAEGARLNAIEEARPKFAAVQDAISATLDMPQPSAKHKADWTLGTEGEDALPWDDAATCERKPQYAQPEADAMRMRNNVRNRHTTVVRHGEGRYGNPYHQ